MNENLSSAHSVSNAVQLQWKPNVQANFHQQIWVSTEWLKSHQFCWMYVQRQTKSRWKQKESANKTIFFYSLSCWQKWLIGSSLSWGPWVDWWLGIGCSGISVVSKWLASVWLLMSISDKRRREIRSIYQWFVFVRALICLVRAASDSGTVWFRELPSGNAW
jgi:hypothetical protein